MSPTYRSFGKINLHLQVVGRRPDGYHELRTVFQTVDLHDLVGVELAGRGVELELTEGSAPAGEENLAVRAARGFLASWAPGEGCRLKLAKRIPIGGGLGGGSSDAATVLLALQELLGAPVPPADLWRLARDLGADVPFFLVGGTALGVGRGDEVVPLPDLEERELWLVTPPVSIPTASVFGALEDLTGHSMAPSIVALAHGAGGKRVEAVEGWNDLQELVFRHFPVVQRVYNVLRGAGADPVRLSGSGATLFACFAEDGGGGDWRDHLPPATRVIRSRTLSRASLAARRIVH